MSGRRRHYSDQEKMVAVELWAQGTPTVDIAERTGVPQDTLETWRTEGKPIDWHLYRADIIKEARQATRDRMLRHQEEIHERHFQDWEKVRQATVLAMAHRVTEDGREVLRPRTDLSPKQLRDIATTLSQVQKGQRLALGIPSDFILNAPAGEGDHYDEEAALERAGFGPTHLRQMGDLAAKLLAAPVVIEVPAEDADAD